MKKRNTVRAAFTLVCVAALLVTVIYAIFFRTIAAQAELHFGDNQFYTQCTLSAVTDTAAVSGSSAVLKTPGDRVQLRILAKNDTGDIPLSYQLRITGTGTLSPCVFATMDGVFLGSLQEENGIYTLPGTYYLAPGQTGAHTLELELHIGAQSYLSAARTCEVTVLAQAQSVDLEQVTFVQSAEELEQICLLSATNGLKQSTVVLGGNLALGAKSLTLKTEKNLTLELNGQKLDLQSGALTLTGGLLELRDNRGINQITGGTLRVDGETALVCGNALDGYDGTFVPGVYDTNRLVEEYVIPCVQENTKHGILSQQSAQVLGGYRHYQLAAAAEGLTYAPASGVVTAPQTDISRNGTLTFSNGMTVAIPLIGASAEAQIAAIEAQYLSFLLPAEGQAAAFVSNDLYLPGCFKEYGCTVTWWSSNPDAITALGAYTPELEQQSANLVATFQINGKQIAKTYPLQIRGQSHEERLSYLIAYYNAILLESVGPEGGQELLTAQNYAEKCKKNLNITDITYSVSPDYAVFMTAGEISLGSNAPFLALYLTRTTYFTTATLELTVTFGDVNIDGTNTASGTIPVFILLEDRVTTDEMQAAVTQAAKRTFYEVMTDKDAPCLFIDLPMQYQQNAISYYIPNTKTGAADGETTVTPQNKNEADPYGTVDGKTVISGAQGQNYLVVSEGDLDLAAFYGSPVVKEAVNAPNTYDAITGSVVMKLETVSVIDPDTGDMVEREEQVPYFRLTLNPQYLQIQEQKLSVVAYLKEDAVSSGTGMRCVISVTIPAAVRAAAGAFPNEAAFQRVYTAVGDTTDQKLGDQVPTFILMKRLQSANVRRLDFSGIGGLSDEDVEGLKFFSDLTELNLSAPAGNANRMQKILPTVAKFVSLERLTLENCGITDLSPIEPLKGITSLDLSGNSELEDVTSVAEFAGVLRWLDVTGTKVNLTYNEWALAYGYYKRLDATAGVEALTVVSDQTPDGTYAPAYAGLGNQNKLEYKRLVYQLARMAEIDEINTRYIWLPRSFIEKDVGSFGWIEPLGGGLALETGPQEYVDQHKKNGTNTMGTIADVYQYRVEDSVAAGGTVLGALEITNGSTDTGTGAYTPTVTCTRYFFIHYVP